LSNATHTHLVLCKGVAGRYKDRLLYKNKEPILNETNVFVTGDKTL